MKTKYGEVTISKSWYNPPSEKSPGQWTSGYYTYRATTRPMDMPSDVEHIWTGTGDKIIFPK